MIIMSLTEVYQSLGAPLYYVVVGLCSLLLGLFSGWLLWYASARRYDKAIDDLDLAKREVDYAKTENARLRDQVENAETPPSSNDVVARMEFGKLDGMNPKLAAAFCELEIKNLEQLETLTSEERVDLEQQFATRGILWNWGTLSHWRAALTAAAGSDPVFDRQSETVVQPRRSKIKRKSGLNSTMRAAVSVDWSKLDGVNQQLADGLNDLGFENVGQLEQLSTTERARIERELLARDVTIDWCNLANWKSAESALGDFIASQSSESLDSAMQRPLQGKTSATDQPTSKRNGKSHRRVDSYSSPTPVSSPAPVSSSPSGRLTAERIGGEDDGKPVVEFEKQTGQDSSISRNSTDRHPTTQEIQQKAYEVYCHRIDRGLGGGEKSDWDQAEWELRGNPIFGYGVPQDVDDFSAQYGEITDEARDELYRMGLFNRHQIDSLDADARERLTRWFADPRFGLDLPTALNRSS